MSHDALEEMLSRFLDNDLNEDEREILAERLARDPVAKAQLTELQQMRELASAPVPAPLPGMQERLAAKVAAKYQKQHSGFLVWLRQLITVPTPAMAFAAAVLVIAGAWMLWPKGGQLEFNSLQRDVDKAQREFHAAVVRMENAARDQMATMPDWLADDYAENLRLVNEAIASCEELIEAQPANTEAYASLRLAYQAKVRLLEKIMTPVGG